MEGNSPKTTTSRKRSYKFKPEWELQFGLRVKERKYDSSEARLVECKFCVAFGREEGYTKRIRRKTQSIKLWSNNFRSDQIRQHMLINHPIKYREYTNLSMYDRSLFFNPMNSVETSKQNEEEKTLILPNFQDIAMLPSSELIKHKNCYVVGIAGGSGSGKTTIANRLVNRVGAENIAHLSHDTYYRDLSHLAMPERGNINFDHPESLETGLFVQHILALKAGNSVRVPIYDFTTHSRKAETRLVEAKPILLIEGILLFADKNLRECLDCAIYIDTESDIRFIRRMKRDVEERGRSINSVTEQYVTSVRPMHNMFVEPSKQFADVILPGGNNLDVAVDLLSVRFGHSLLSNSNGTLPAARQRQVNVIYDDATGKRIM